MAKRLVDILFSFIGLFLFSPLILLTIFLIKLEDRGPVFYRGVRVGRHGKSFRIFKFRTMVVDAEKLGGPSTPADDPRLTKIGKILRKYNLDEFPQFINVLKGDMSIVGPRPEVPQYVEMFTDEEKEILSVRPGITDWASIWNADEGGVLADAQDPDAIYEEVIRPIKMKLQFYYYATRNFFEDIKIICYTFYRLINKNWTPKELIEYPTFDELRAQALHVIERQKEELKSAAG